MSTGLRLFKMSGAGNDFIVFGPRAAGVVLERRSDWIPRLCRRRLSIGADGILVVERAGAGRVKVSFFNPDGSQAFCGNGSRCAARFAHLEGLVPETMILETAVGDVPAEVRGERVRLTLPVPRDDGQATVVVDGETLAGRRVSAGVPHFVVDCAALNEAPLARWGPIVRRHPMFGEDGVNLDLVGPTSGEVLSIRTFERGVEGETLSCGTGALAAAFRHHLERGGTRRVTVLPASGVPLEVSFPGPPEAPRSALLTGDARVVFEGELGPDALAVSPP